MGCRNKFNGVDGVSILKPLKGADAALALNLESFFSIHSEIPYELLFSLESKQDTAYGVLTDVIKRFPWVSASIFVLEENQNPNSSTVKNPKLRNLSLSFEHAKFDTILISDSNVRLKPGELEALVSELSEDTGIVTAIVSGIEFRGIGGALESVFLGTFYARFMALCNRYAKPCVVGKAMLFRKSQAVRFGGLRLLSEFLAEDFMAGESMRKLGLKIKTSSMSVNQVLGRHSVETFWLRHIRWGRIRKSHAPLPFFFEPFFGPLPMSLLGAYGIHHLFLLNALQVFAASWAYLGALDFLCYVRVTRCPILFIPCFPLIWTLRECLALPLWIRIASGNDVDWRGSRFTLAPGGLLRDK